MKKDTKIVHAGYDKDRNGSMVNTPVYHGSTVLFDSKAEIEDALQRGMVAGEKVLFYGRRGSPTHWTLQDAVTELEGGYSTVIVPSGLNAVTTAILSFVRNGDHLLMLDSVYEPSRRFCDGLLKDFGAETTYYDPHIGSDIKNLIQHNTKAIFCESPGSHTFEVQDLPAIAEAAHKQNVKVLVDNTWASPLYCQPLGLGCDISIQAATKYVVGHSDALVGTITTTEECFQAVHRTNGNLGLSVSPDDVYLATRGFRTMAVRLRQHQSNALQVAQWLDNRPEVKRVLYPPLPSDPGHDLWKRDFSGASGLLGVVFKRTSEDAVFAFLEGLKYFPIGYSWGGFESLSCPSVPSGARTATQWTEPEPGVRLHIGLEDVDDLREDLEIGLDRFSSALK